MNKAKLSEIAQIVMGQSPKGETCNKDNVGDPLLNGPTEFGTFYPVAKQFSTDGKKYSIEGDILFCVRGSTTGRMNISNIEYVLGRGLAAIRHKCGIEYNTYLKYLIEYNLSPILKLTTGSTFPNLTADNLLNFNLLIPSVKDQLKISNILSNLDTKIELNNKINQDLEAMAKTIYDYWFVQFDFPDVNGKPYKSSGGKMVFNEELKREIPEGWENGTIGEIADLIRGVSYSKDDIKTSNDKGVVPILRATNITGNVVDLNKMVYVPNQFVNLNQILNKFEILITMSSGSKDHIGKNGFYYFEDKVGFGAFCAKLVAKNNFRYYLYSYTQSDFMFATIKNESLGTNINNLNNSLVNGFTLVKPPNGLLEEFNAKVRSAYKTIANNTQQNQKLVELRDWLLPMLMNGQVTVGEAEEQINSSTEHNRSMAAEDRENYKCK